MWTSTFGWPLHSCRQMYSFGWPPSSHLGADILNGWPLSGFSFTDTDDAKDSRGREGTIFCSTLPLPPAHEHSEMYLQLCTWDDCNLFLFALLVFTRLLLDERFPTLSSYQTIWLTDDAMLMSLFIWWSDSRFLLQQFDRGNQWTRTRIDYHLFITSEPTNQVC